MKSLTIITKQNIDTFKVKELIKLKFKNSKVVDEKDNYLFMGKSPKSFMIDFFDNDSLDNPEYGFNNETLNLIPFSPKLCTDVSYHDFKTVKDIISTLLVEYNDMWIYDDDYNWIGSAIDFINSNHQDPDSGYIPPNNSCLKD